MRSDWIVQERVSLLFNRTKDCSTHPRLRQRLMRKAGPLFQRRRRSVEETDDKRSFKKPQKASAKRPAKGEKVALPALPVHDGPGLGHPKFVKTKHEPLKAPVKNAQHLQQGAEGKPHYGGASGEHQDGPNSHRPGHHKVENKNNNKNADYRDNVAKTQANR